MDTSDENGTPVKTRIDELLGFLHLDFKNTMPSPDGTRVVAWNEWETPGLVLDILARKVLFEIPFEYFQYYWIKNGAEIVATDRIITCVYDGMTGKHLRNVEAMYD